MSKPVFLDLELEDIFNDVSFTYSDIDEYDVLSTINLNYLMSLPDFDKFICQSNKQFHAAVQF